MLVSDVSKTQSVSIFKGQVILDSLELPDHADGGTRSFKM